eukprot:6491883-Amphidinium_carterae.3
MENTFRQDHQARKRTWNFHRWFQQPIWRLEALVGSGPYTLAGEHHEPITRTWEVPDGNALPDGPSRRSFAHYQQLLQAWETVTEIPTGAPRLLGGPPMERWDVNVIRAGFRSLTGITPNMLDWIVESAIQEAICTPHPDNLISLLDYELRDRFGRTTKQGQFNMLFSYVSGEENDFQTVHFWFEKKKMVMSLSFNSEDNPINGEQVRRINELKRRRAQRLEEQARDSD